MSNSGSTSHRDSRPPGDPSAALARAAFQASPDLLVITDLEGKIVDSNQAWRKSLGVNTHSLIGKPWSAVVNFLKVSAPESHHAAALPDSYVIAFNTRQKEAKWFAWTKISLPEQNAHLWTGHEIILDIGIHPSLLEIFYEEIPASIVTAQGASASRAAHDHDEEQAAVLPSTSSIRLEMLEDSAAVPISQVIEHMPGLLFELKLKNDGSFQFVYVTENVRKLFHLSAEELYQTDPSILFLPRDVPGLLIELFESSQSLKPVSWEGRLQTEDNQGYWVQLYATPAKNAQGTILWYGLMLDIHLQRMAEASLELERAKAFGAAKMAALGEMTAGVAHEINNPLAVILGKAEQLGEIASGEVPYDAERLSDSVEKIVKMTQRISKIIRGLRSFARDAENDPFESRSVAQIVEDSVELCNARFRSNNVKLQVDPVPADLVAECRAVQISQVILNLLNNSFDAVQGFDQKWVKIRCERTGDSVFVFVTDCGKGIPADVAAHIMAPFFTTKPAGKGTGLGLSISRGIIEDHGGKIHLDATQSNTTFVVEIPIRQIAKVSASGITAPRMVAKKAG